LTQGFGMRPRSRAFAADETRSDHHGRISGSSATRDRGDGNGTMMELPHATSVKDLVRSVRPLATARVLEAPPEIGDGHAIMWP